MHLDYRAFIEDNFLIKSKTGEVVPFVLNPTQRYYVDLLEADYPDMQGIRENILKFRQPGFSSLIDAIFTTDFIFSELGEIPIIDADIYSHKESETKVLFERCNFFLESFLQRLGQDPMISGPIPRKSFLETDTAGLLKGRRGAQIHVQTANARVSGRGGTKQNIHWSEVAFYPDTLLLSAADLVRGAEQQVADGVGKIFRETTGNMEGDFFHTEYERGKEGQSAFKSRFLAWYIHPEYAKTPPAGWQPPAEYRKLMAEHPVTIDQCYWHFWKISNDEDPAKAKREYPSDDIESFLQQGMRYFDMDALRFYMDSTVRKPLPEVFV